MKRAIARALLLGALSEGALIGCTTDLPSDAEWPDRREPISGEAPLGYVTNNGEDTVSVVELATMTEIARRSVGTSPVDPEAPHHLAIDRAAGFLYVGLSNVGLIEGGGLHGSHGSSLLPSYVQRLRLADLGDEGDVRVDPDLGDIVLAGPGRVASTHFDLALALANATMGGAPEEGYGALVVVDGDTMERAARIPVCTAPHGLAITTDDGGGALGIVACYGDDAVAFVDLDADPPTVLARAPVGPMPGTVSALRYGPYSVAVAPDRTFAYVGALDGTSVRRIDLATRADDPGGAVLVDGAAFFGSFDPDGARFWIATQVRDTVTAIDVASSAIAMRRPFTREECVAPHEAVYVASIDRVVVACEGDHVAPGRLVSLDPESLEITGSVEVGVFPDVLRVIEP